MTHPITGQTFPSPVPPGTGWPDDPAGPRTPVARDAGEVRVLAAAAVAAADLPGLDAAVSVCRACPRLVTWRERVATDKRRQYADQPYWGRPVPGWGAPEPKVLVVGLAPAAHGGNRTGRIFTGDRSGDWIFAGLHRAGLATLPASTAAGDGQRLIDTRMVAAVRCAPPDNKPAPAERDTCAGWLDAELALVWPHVRAVVALGQFAWQTVFGALDRMGQPVPRPRPRFGHGTEHRLPSGVLVIGCYHPSQQNTFTGRLTETMLDAVLSQAAAHAGVGCGTR